MRPIPPLALLVSSFLLQPGIQSADGSKAIAPDLIAAVKDGDSVRVEAIVKAGGERNSRDQRGNTALHWAALSGNARFVQLLLTGGFDARATNLAGATPLHYGAAHERIVRDLLRAGADVNARSVAGSTPLHAAASRPGSTAAVKRLLAAGAKVDALRPVFPEGDVTALALAVNFGDAQTARLLLEHGAAPGGTNGYTPVAAAAFAGREQLLKELVKRGGAVNFDEGFAGHALNNVLYADHRNLVKFLIEHGADLHQASSFGEHVPPIVWSAYIETGDPTVTRQLLDRGIDINEATSAGSTALSWALKRGETPLTALLRSRGATAGGESKRKTVPHNAVPVDADARQQAIRVSIQRAVDLLQKSSEGFLDNPFARKSACVSCHQQTLPAVAFGRARDRGFQLNETSLARQLIVQRDAWSRSLDFAYEMREPQPDAPANLGYGLFGLHALGYVPDELTEAMVWYLAQSQLPDGSFPSYDRRPPLEEGQVIGTALALGALRLYPQPLKNGDLDRRVANARRWLEHRRPENPNQRISQLLGLGWAGAAPSELKRLASELLALQKPDGGWAPLPGLEADAWTTGMALFALSEAGGLSANDPACGRGVDFLLRTQFADGSWWVRSRTWPFQPHFDSGFPHGKDQWISAGGTAWAVIALVNATAPAPAGQDFPSAQVVMARHAGVGGIAPAVSQGSAASDSSKATEISAFVRDILPILQKSCLECHKGEKAKGGLRVDVREELLKGGQSGEAAVIPGKPDASPIVRYVLDEVEDLEMPPLGKRTKFPALTTGQVAQLKAWIAAGAN